MSKRAHISFKTKYAAALRLVGDIPYLHAKLMHEDQIISLFSVDHGILHAIDPIDEHWNLTPTLRGPHKEKSRKDTGIVAKVKRQREKFTPIKVDGHEIEFVVDDDNPGVARRPDPVRDPELFKPAPRRKGRGIQSPGFRKDTRPKGQRFGNRRRG